MGIDLDAYFLRIGYGGKRTPTLETLRAVTLLHPQAIAFENLNSLMRWPVPLDLESLQRKMVYGGRGGYCYEHNLLLSHALKALGFQVRELAGRVVWRVSNDAMNPRTHVLLHVTVDGQPYIADAGFGSRTLTSPLRIETNIEQPTPHEPFRLLDARDDFLLQVKSRGEWIGLYRFDLRELILPDFEVGNWYTSTHPNSRFVADLLVARTDCDCRRTLRNNVLSTHYLNGGTLRRKLGNIDEMRDALRREFRLSLPDAQELDVVLQRATKQPAQSSTRRLDIS